jgi:drug/metabolite transporter (DMT)-like permease
LKQSVTAAYLCVILLWATTPLGIVWSSESIHPSMAVMARMVIAACMGWVVISLSQIQLPLHARALRLYAYSGIGIFGGMSFAYLASTYLPSGLISLFFGLSPLVSGVLAQSILNEKKFTPIQKSALVIAMAGLIIVVSDSLNIDSLAWPGLIFVSLGVFFFCYSAVLVKSVDIQIHPIATTTGALTMTLPAFLVVWYIMDGSFDYNTWGNRSIYSIVYLGVFASFIGFIAYYYILQNMLASTVALITLVTPILAIALGTWLNQEPIGLQLVIGASAVIIGLGLYTLGDKWLKSSRVQLRGA